MQAGKLRHTITIERPVETQDDFGTPQVSWVAFASGVRASIEPIRGREYFSSAEVRADVTHKIGLRYIAGIAPKMRVSFGSRKFNITSVLNIDERNRELQLMAFELV